MHVRPLNRTQPENLYWSQDQSFAVLSGGQYWPVKTGAKRREWRWLRDCPRKLFSHTVFSCMFASVDCVQGHFDLFDKKYFRCISYKAIEQRKRYRISVDSQLRVSAEKNRSKQSNAIRLFWNWPADLKLSMTLATW